MGVDLHGHRVCRELHILSDGPGEREKFEINFFRKAVERGWRGIFKIVFNDMQSKNET